MSTVLGMRWSMRLAGAALIATWLHPGVASAQAVEAIHSFTGCASDCTVDNAGAHPRSTLVDGGDGHFFGSTYDDGPGIGTIFKIAPTGALTTLVNFNVPTVPPSPEFGPRGCFPWARLTLGSDGMLYGAAPTCGMYGDGTLFKVTTDGVFAKLHDFDTNGQAWPSGLVEAGGALYGVTTYAGDSGLGSVFRLESDGSITTLHSFSGLDGQWPMGELVLASDGNLYGTTSAGGGATSACGAGFNGCGTVFRVLLPSATVELVHAFDHFGGALPGNGNLIEGADGALYGIADGGGSYGGVAFRLALDGTFTSLHDFTEAEGYEPNSPLVEGEDGNFYGTITQGGPLNIGTVYRMTPAGAVTVLHHFTGPEGERPFGGLTLGTDGVLYGTAYSGGAYDLGTVFRVVLPWAQPGTLAVDEDAAAGGTLVATRPGGGALTYSVVANGTKGTAVITDANTGAFTYTANGDETGTDTFTFTAHDGFVASNIATVTVTIASINDAPIALDGAASTAPGVPVNGTLDADDVDSATMTFALVTTGGKGMAVLTDTATGAYTYSPNAGASGTDTFTFTANDWEFDSNVGTVTVTITKPDLVESAVSAAATSAAPGGTLSVTDTVLNQGSQPAGASATRYYLSLDAVKSAGDLLLSGTRAVPILAAGASSTGSRMVTVPSAATLATYQLLACADDLPAVSEANEGNNCGVSGGTVVVARPDLVETSVSTAATSATPGGTFVVTDTVQNQGAGPAGASTTTRYYLSLDLVKDGTDLLLTGTRPVPALAPGASSAGTRTVMVPATVPLATYRVLACADDLVRVTETSEANNCLGAGGTLVVARPDLVETTVSNPPATIVPGANFTVTDTVRNQGAGPAGASTTRYYLSLDAVKDGTDVLLTGTRPVAGLGPGATSAGGRTVTVPLTTPLATYQVVACTDDLVRVTEGDEANNCTTGGGQMLVGRPDLVTTSVSAPPASLILGGTFGMTDTVLNQGQLSAGSSTTRYYLSLDTVKGAGDLLLTATRAVASLVPGASSTGARTLTALATAPTATYFVLACADDLAKVGETSDANNCQASPTTMTLRHPPPFQTTANWAAFDPHANGVGSAPFGFHGGVFDGTYVYFAPHAAGNKEVMRYDTRAPFNAASSWEAYDPHPPSGGGGYSEGAFDGRYVYFAPHDNGVISLGEVLRFDTTQPFNDPGSWQTFDPSQNGVGTSPKGYWGAFFDGRYLYFAPEWQRIIKEHGEVLRYDTTLPFTAPSSWLTFDAGAHGVGTDPDGYKGIISDGAFIYFAPYYNGTASHGEVLRYDRSLPFDSPMAWTTYKPANFGVGNIAKGFEGMVSDGHYIYFVPSYAGWGPGAYHGEVLRYDPSLPFDLPSSWAAFDPGSNGVGVDPDGYNGAVFDGRYIIFGPSNNGSGPHAEVLLYDTTLPFGSPGSWMTFNPAGQGVGTNARGFAGTVYDGRYIYFVPDRNSSGPHDEVLRYDTQP